MSTWNVGSWIERRARLAPDRLALVHGDRALTYRELARRIRRLAAGLQGLGVGRGDRVTWLGPNHPAFLEGMFACGLLGAVLAPVNHRLPAPGIARILRDLEPSALLLHAAPAPAVPGSVRSVVEVGATGPTGLEALVAGAAREMDEAPVGPDDLLLLPHTSGTTGRPKGVMLTHGNVTWNAINVLTCSDLRADDVTVAVAPFFRVGGTGVNVLPVLFRGGTVVVPGESGPERTLELVERHRVTVGFANPDLLDALARSPSWGSADLSSLRFVLTGGAPVPERLIRTFQERGVPLLQGYGLSEAGPVALLLDPGDAPRKVGSAGRPPLFVDVRIVAPDGREVGPGETGELEIRGPNVMAGYWRRPAATREALTPDGWLRTGDAARADEEGFVWVVDRLADRFTCDGHDVYPGDVERALLEHPGIEEAGVVGVPAGPRGEVGAAFLVRSPDAWVGADELLARCRKRLAPHQVPASITFLERLPRNPVGKLMRDELRALANQGRP
ncbi:MAG TPA: AMP-binding protein [Actinomycetota bacterium]|nr:AMP-binding protein [Actinomycetota bacterium]